MVQSLSRLVIVLLAARGPQENGRTVAQGVVLDTAIAMLCAPVAIQAIAHRRDHPTLRSAIPNRHAIGRSRLGLFAAWNADLGQKHVWCSAQAETMPIAPKRSPKQSGHAAHLQDATGSYQTGASVPARAAMVSILDLCVVQVAKSKIAIAQNHWL